MNVTAEKIVHDALELPSQLRAFVAEKLIESLDDAPSYPLSPKWKTEVRRRCAELDECADKLRDAESVFKKAFDSIS